MTAPEGNRFWEQRSKHGRNPKFENPEALWGAAVEYFEWVEANPLKSEKIGFYEGVAVRATVDKMRAMSIVGLCCFLDIVRSTWDDYCGKQDFSDITGRIQDIIRAQKFEGAAADLLNANIIARDLGLADKQEHAGPGGAPIVPVINVTIGGAQS